MADEESPKQRTFWGRVTEFVKNPTQDWALTRHENALREQQEQEHQRAREEQRKLDAFIRKRELAALRRLRKQQASGETPDLVFSDLPDTGAGVSAPKAPQREATLRKINEIERAMVQDSTAESRPHLASLAPTAQMTRPPAPPPQSTQPLSFASTNTSSRLPARAGAEQATMPAPTQLAPTQMASGQLEPTRLAADPHDPGMLQPPFIDPTRIDPTRIDPTRIDATQLAPTRLGAVATTEPPLSPLSGESSWLRSSQPSDPTRSMAVDVQEGVSSSPLFDQACMDFANGNDQGAERALLEAISGSPERKLENEFWLALFDLYRAGGDMQRFEALVVDYLDRFQSSAPSWGAVAPAAAPGRGATSGGAQASFAALGEFDAAQARALLQLARGGATSVSLDFNALTSAAPGAEQALAEALKVLNAASGCEVEVAGLDHLLEACAAQSPAMQRDSDAAWWNARLEALRLAGAQEAFEATALDYCVTYEISPPSWEPSRARVRLNTSESAAAAGSTRGGEATGRVATRFANSEMDGVALAHLDGEIRGGSEDFLQPLDEAAAGRSAVLVDLSALRRLDFASAGIVLNWVMAQSSAGRSVRFEGTHRLIAGLFAILGISSVAQVELRKT